MSESTNKPKGHSRGNSVNVKQGKKLRSVARKCKPGKYISVSDLRYLLNHMSAQQHNFRQRQTCSIV